jgi:hypothetical protein
MEAIMFVRKYLTTPIAITILLILQFIPMVLFPLESFSFKTQEWWLPVILAVLALISTIQLFRQSTATWPWHLIGFSQGFNIISRLMMIFPHATYNLEGAQYFNTAYVILSLVSMAFSAFLLWYTELPEVRMGLLR